MFLSSKPPRSFRGGFALCFCLLLCLLCLGCKKTASKQEPSGASSSESPQPGPLELTASRAKASLVPAGALLAKLKQSLASKPKDYRPRTKHKQASGAPKYTNRLILENSPYLLQHAHNPVNWFPWGDEAFAMARALGRPIFLSVGYSTCHWCHVMEEESFEDEPIAQFINDNYIPVKVDREERPDVDSVYMTAVQMLTGRGGWPMSVWLTPELEPFFGGTYFPARDGDRGSRVGFLSHLKRQATAYKSDPKTVAEKSKQLSQRMQSAMAPTEVGEGVDSRVLRAAWQAATRRYDDVHGGPKGAPKFPSSFPHALLLRLGASAGFLGPEGAQIQRSSADMALASLTKMAQGGIYDQIGGGFHRYSVDKEWLVPHFEKMLYDNAQLALTYVEAYQLSKQPQFKRVAIETLDYVAREMTAPNGGFYSATDADSLTPSGHREEGYYFTWTLAELSDALTPTEYELVRRLYSPTRDGNFERRNILFLESSLENYSKTQALPMTELTKILSRVKQKLRKARDKRAAPLLDDKIQTSWNGLMLGAFARAASVFKSAEYQAIAEKNARFFIAAHKEHGRIRHSVRDGQWSQSAFLDDYAFYAHGLIELFQSTQNATYLSAAKAQLDELEQWHADSVRGGYYLTASDQAKLLVREKPDYDKAIPSGNSYALLAQQKLHQLLLDDTYRARAETTLRAFSPRLKKSPMALSEMLRGVYFQLSGPKQVVLALPAGEKDGSMLDLLRSDLFPSAVRVFGTEAELSGRLKKTMPWISGKQVQAGRPTAYVCEEGSCQRPTNDAVVFRDQLRGAPAQRGKQP